RWMERSETNGKLVVLPVAGTFVVCGAIHPAKERERVPLACSILSKQRGLVQYLDRRHVPSLNRKSMPGMDAEVPGPLPSVLKLCQRHAAHSCIAPSPRRDD